MNKFNQHVASAYNTWPTAQNSDKLLLWAAVLAFFLGTVLLLANGLQTGFHSVQFLSLILPPIAWEHLSFMGDTLVVLTLALLFAYRYPHLLFALLITAIVGTLITHGIKPWLATPRPPGVLDPGSFQLIGSSISRKSMPSGHTLTAFAAAGLLIRLTTNKAIQFLILIAACFIGWSRVSVGVHWPADVCMGAAGGLLSAWAGLQLCDRWQRFFSGRFYLILLIIHAGCA
uniref:phosphatase PAP2 family protein n=1 Tax=Neptunomonas sp. TaxID=1971898 RepID=UPI0035650BDA